MRLIEAVRLLVTERESEIEPDLVGRELTDLDSEREKERVTREEMDLECVSVLEGVGGLVFVRVVLSSAVGVFVMDLVSDADLSAVGVAD